VCSTMPNMPQDLRASPITANPSSKPSLTPARRLRLWTLGLSLLLIGCASEPLPPTPEVVPEPPASIDPKRLADLLETAELAITKGELTYPPEVSALAQYQRILSIEAGQEDAIRGIESIVEIFVERSLVALSKRQFAEARSMLARARLIDPEHPSIVPTQAQIQLIAEAEREQLRLDQAALGGDQDMLREQLKALANTPEGLSCRFYIWAKNDNQGRWIYNALAAGADGQRLQAQVEIRLPASVERLCFDT